MVNVLAVVGRLLYGRHHDGYRGKRHADSSVSPFHKLSLQPADLKRLRECTHSVSAWPPRINGFPDVIKQVLLQVEMCCVSMIQPKPLQISFSLVKYKLQKNKERTDVSSQQH